MTYLCIIFIMQVSVIDCIRYGIMQTWIGREKKYNKVPGMSVGQ